MSQYKKYGFVVILNCVKIRQQLDLKNPTNAHKNTPKSLFLMQAAFFIRAKTVREPIQVVWYMKREI